MKTMTKVQAKRRSKKQLSNKNQSKIFIYNAIYERVPFISHGIHDNRNYRVWQNGVVNSILTTSNTLQTFASWYYTVSLIDQISSFSSVFDQYKVNRLIVYIHPRVTTDTAYSLSGAAVVVDYDDANALTSFASALDYPNAAVGTIHDGFRVEFSPHIAVAAYSGAFTSYKNEPANWIDMASTGVQHYGIKVAYEVTSVNNILIDLTFSADVSFRNVR
jgi:hypothetical protein